MAIDLKGRQLEAFRDALVGAFPSWSELDAMAELGLDVKLESIVARGPTSAAALELIRWARAQGRTDDLVAAALSHNGTNIPLRHLAFELALSSDTGPAPALTAALRGSVGSDAAEWRLRTEENGRRICEIEIPTSNGGWRSIGIGCLVGPDVMLTTYGVAEILQAGARARFKGTRDEVNADRMVPLIPTSITASSPVRELNFVLLGLPERVGDDPMVSGTRGWLGLSREPLGAADPLVLLQPPDADRRTVGIGAMTNKRAAPPRLICSTSLTAVAPGAPWCSLRGVLVGLHEGANDASIPTSLIVDALTGAGVRLPESAALVASSSRDRTGAMQRSRVFISYRRQGEEAEFAGRLAAELAKRGHSVFRDVNMAIGTDWAKEISRNIAESDAFIVVMSEKSVAREMVQTEVREAFQRNRRTGKPALLPIRFQYEGALDYEIDCYVGRLHHATWDQPADEREVIEQVIRGVEGAIAQPAHVVARDRKPITRDDRPAPSVDPRSLSVPGGTMMPEDPLYVRRRGDGEVDSLARQEQGQTLVIRGPRQSGKSSLLMRYLAGCYAGEKKIAFIDFQIFGDELENYSEFLSALALAIQNELEIDEPAPKVTTQSEMNAFLSKRVLRAKKRVVLAFDEVDRVTAKGYDSEFFGMLRVWHNNRAKAFLQPEWKQLDLAFVISTEPEVLIQTGHQSPFNVGTLIALRNFSLEQCHELNSRYGDRALPSDQVEELYDLLGGHPYLMRIGFHRAINARLRFPVDVGYATDPLGPFGDHLRAMVTKLTAMPDLLAAFLEVVRKRKAPSADADYKLKGAGLLKPDVATPTPANLLYTHFFRKLK